MLLSLFYCDGIFGCYTSPPVDSPTSLSAMPECQDQLPHSPAARAERSMSLVGDRDPSESPPPSPPPAHVKGKGK
jgi:hypothetical protein